MVDFTLPLPGLSPVEGKEIVARFDGGRLSSDGGLLVLREIERRLSVADRLSHLVPQGHRQSVPAVPARRRLLAAVESAHADAPTLTLARRPVRHAQAAPDQDRRPHRRDETQDQDPSAGQRPRSGGLAPRPRPAAAARDLHAGAVCPGRLPLPATSSASLPYDPPP